MENAPIARRALGAVFAASLLAASLLIAVPQAPAQQRQEDPIARSRHGISFDSRDRGSPAIAGRRIAEARTALAGRLGSQAVVSPDPATGTLRYVGRLDGFLTGPSSEPAAAIALDYVQRHLAAFGLGASDLKTFRFREDYVDVLGTHHLSWVQTVGGVQAFPNGLKANVTGSGQLINVTGSPATGLTVPAAEPRFGRAEAIATARAAAGGPVVRLGTDDAERVLFPTARGTRLAWRTTTWVGSDAILSVVDAETGEILWRADLSRSDVPGSGVAWDSFPGAGVPNGGGVEQAVSFPVFDGTALSGNNAHVWADVDADLVPDPSEEIPASSGVDWNYPAVLDTTTATQDCSAAYPCTWDSRTPFSWQANLNHSGTQVYYFLNRFHDHLLAPPIAFTEAAGNFQVTNTTGQGVGGDAVLGHALLGANTAGGLPDEFSQNNAFMATFPDGTPPIMGMFLFQSPFGSVHGGDDASIVYHEYTHGLLGRLITFPDGTDANAGFQAGSMNEGWADWYALDFLANDGFVVDGSTVGDVVVGEYPTSGAGIRLQPIDCTVGTTSGNCADSGFGAGAGGYTFGDLGTVFAVPEVHEDGQIWAQTMWDIRRDLGSSLATSLATRGLELSPPDPSFLDVRNAIIQADLVATGGTNADALWQAFAERGMGFFASTPDGGDTSAIEDFSLPPDCSADPCGTLSGTVEDKITGKALRNARVFIAGHSTGFATDLADRTDTNGKFSIANVPFHAYPELVVEAKGYEPRIRGVSVNGDEIVNVTLFRDWAALEKGARLRSFTPPDYEAFCGANADGAFDLSLSVGWPSDAPGSTAGSGVRGPRKAVVQLPKAVDVTAFRVASGGTCGDGPDAGVKRFAIETRRRGGPWVLAASGKVSADGVLHTFRARAGKENVRFIRFIMKSNHGNPDFMDVLEVVVRGR